MANPSLTPQKKSSKLLKVLSVIFILLILCLGTLWIWSGSNGSLAQGISLAQRFLKPGQSISATNVQGSLRNGGHIENLQWHQEGLDVNLTDVTLDWQLLSALLSKKLTINSLSIDQLQIIRQKPATEATPSVATSDRQNALPPQEIILPIQIDLKQLHINQITEGQAPRNLLASNLISSFEFDGTQHRVKINSVHIADGNYQGQLTLQAKNQQLDAQFTGELKTTVPQSSQSINLTADVKISGPLTQLRIDAHAQTSASQASNASTAPKAQLQAVLMPWSTLMVPEANLALQSFNPHAFWPQAPQSLLSGTAKITSSPESASSTQQRAFITADLKNTNPGTLDLSKLPITALNIKAHIQEQIIHIEQLNALIGQGHINLTGNYHLPQKDKPELTPPWEISSTFNSIDPQLLYSTMARDQISGTIVASQKTAQSINFNAKLNAANSANIAKFRVHQLNTQGTFVIGKHIQFNTLDIQAIDGRIQGNVTYTLASQAITGPLKLTAPGLDATITLNTLAPNSGSAHIQLNVHSINETLTWLRPKQTHMQSLVNFLQNAQKYTQKLADYVQNIPITVEGGWKNPQVKVQIDLNALIQKIIADVAKKELASRLHLGNPLRPASPEGTPQPPSSSDLRRGVLNQLGQGLLNRHK